MIPTQISHSLFIATTTPCLYNLPSVQNICPLSLNSLSLHIYNSAHDQTCVCLIILTELEMEMMSSVLLETWMARTLVLPIARYILTTIIPNYYFIQIYVIYIYEYYAHTHTQCSAASFFLLLLLLLLLLWHGLSIDGKHKGRD
jgi:hypothetical protein